MIKLRYSNRTVLIMKFSLFWLLLSKKLKQKRFGPLTKESKKNWNQKNLTSMQFSAENVRLSTNYSIEGKSIAKMWKGATCLRFFWITNSSDHRSVSTVNLLHKKSLPNLLGHKLLWPSGLGNDFECKRFTVQTLLWSLEFVIQINLEQNTIKIIWKEFYKA